MKIMKVAFWVALTALMLCGTGWGQEAGRLKKKIIAWDWGTTNINYVRDNIRDIEKKPFDGLALQWLKANKDGQEFTFEWHCFGKERFELEDFAETIQVLKDIKFEKFTDNFIRFNVTPGDVDWFDDFSAIVHNGWVAAKIAKETGMKGWMFDVEDYQHRLLDYRRLKYASEKTFDEYAAQARRRGKELTLAINDAYPGMTILLAFGHSYCVPALGRANGLASDEYGLLPAFLEGMLEAAGPGVKIIDGNERAYGYLLPSDYFEGFHAIKQGALPLVSVANRAKYAAKVQAGMALYVNYVFPIPDRPIPSSRPTYYLTHEERLRVFESNVYHALTTADEYVWCYSEGMYWWEGFGRQSAPEGAEEAVRSAKEKVNKGQPLGFDVTGLVKSAQARTKAEMEALAAGIVPRQAIVHPLKADEAPPTIDGSLTDPMWHNRSLLAPFLPLGTRAEADPLKAATEAWVACDDTMLYIAFRCAEPEISRLSLAGKQRDDNIWGGDCVEVLLSPGQEPDPYLHFIVNPANLQWDGQSTEGGDNDVLWNAEWQSATRIGESEWTAELAIPWDAIGGRPQAGSLRRANLCRQRGPHGELSTWSQSISHFLEAERFGVWEFAG